MNKPYENIVCPYCFEKFTHTDVHFRMETVLSNEIIDISDIEHENDLQKKEEMMLKIHFQPRDDEKYKNFWSDYAETTEITTNNERSQLHCEVYQLPVIDPNSNDAEKCLKIQHHKDGQEDYFEYDNSGMVQGVVDTFGRITHRRICPYCHNPLPDGYGKNEVKFISVIGVTQAGKTVYISQLLYNMNRDLYRLLDMPTHAMGDRVSNFIDNNPVKKDIALPDPTMKGRLAQPMTYDLKKSDGQPVTIVIYDIAGEDCIGARGMEKYGKFVTNSHGIILLISPKQVGWTEDYGDQNVEDKKKEDEAPPQTVLDTIYATIIQQQQTHNGDDRSEIPIAVCISKSDFFADSLGDEEINGDEIRRIAKKDLSPYEDPNTGEVSYKFNASEYNILEMRLRKKMIGDPIHGILKSEYKYFNYFIFSAIGCSVKKKMENGEEKSYPVDDPHAIRIAEPLLWLFKRFGYISSNIPIRLPELRGDPNRKIPLNPTWFERVILKKPEFRYLTPEEKEALWYEETC